MCRLAKEYRVRQERIHAILFLKDVEKRMEEENGGPLDSELENEVEEYFGCEMIRVCSTVFRPKCIPEYCMLLHLS